MQLSQIWQYPAKSMLGVQVDTAMLAADGVVGDRMWALRDEVRGAIASARRVSGISALTASVVADGRALSIRLPDGSTVSDTDPDVDEKLSAAVHHRVSLWAKQPASNVDHYRRGRSDSDDMMAELRAVFGRLPDEPLPDFSIFPPEIIEFEYPPGNYFDCYPLMIMSTSAIDSLRTALPGSTIDERRFRPSLVVDTETLGGHPEFAWIGRRMLIGATEVEIRSGCPRCAMITNEFSHDLPRDTSILRHVVRNLDQNVGVYATIVRGGEIALGDSVELV